MIALPNVLRFRKASGLMRRGLIFTDGFGTPKLWVEEAGKLSTDLILYQDAQKTARLAVFQPQGLTAYTAPFNVSDPEGNPLGQVTWQGGPVISKWLMRETDGRELLSDEIMSSAKYAAKLLAKFIPIAIDTSMKTGTMTLLCGGQIISRVIRSGSWFSPMYEIVDLQSIEKHIDLRLMLAAMTCEAIYSNR